ncbi:MAG TPA: DUF1287 domain-containing protein [Pyrinomonadaceae bacterium]|jgi:uncharacterized protein YijF (DUF1287 family)
MKRFWLVLNLFVVLLFNFACRQEDVRRDAPDVSAEKPPLAEIESPVIKAVLESALEQTKITTGYTQDYFVIPYPMGDVPAQTGACTDVVIRAFRRAGVDLQKEVHEDMRANFALYPKKWGLPKPDTNIDHRRVPNLQTFFTRKGKSMPASLQAAKYRPGDVVTWDIDGKGMTHIGLVSHLWNEAENRYLIIHNIGGGTRVDDVLFRWKITGHFRYF